MSVISMFSAMEIVLYGKKKQVLILQLRRCFHLINGNSGMGSRSTEPTIRKNGLHICNVVHQKNNEMR